MKKALLVSESSVYLDENGDFISHGGGEAYFHNLAKSLLSIGIRPTVFAIREFPKQRAQEVIDGVVYKRFPASSKVSLKIWSYLRAAIKESRHHDYILVNQFTPHLILPWVEAKKFAVVHDVYQDKGLKFWTRQYGFFTGLIGNMIEKFQLHFDCKYADKILTVSEISENKLLAFLGPKVKDKLVRLATPAVKQHSRSSKNKENFILFVGRFVDYKNPQHVLHCLKKIKEKFSDFRAVFVAARVEKKVHENFKNLFKQLNFKEEDIEFYLNCPKDKLDNLYARAKILVHPSYVEGQGIVILEALSHGTPVVAYKLEAYKGMLKDKFNSRLVPIEDADLTNDTSPHLALACLEVLENYDFYRCNSCGVLPGFSEEEFLTKLRQICD